jgi:phospholipase A1
MLLFGAEDYAEAVRYYEEQAYEKAFPLVLEEAQKENRAAQYRLAQMYENGYGTEVDYEQAMRWYKRAAARFEYMQSEARKENNTSVLSHIIKQFGNDSIQRGNEYSLSKMDMSTPETKKLLKSIMSDSFFGLQPYATNFLLPLSYGWQKPPHTYEAIPPNDAGSFPGTSSTHDKRTEIEFQFSLKKQLSYDLFGFNEYINIAYTQKVWWQRYAYSGPFRETNYLPDIFVAFPTSQKISEAAGLKGVQLGFLHESNGQEGYRSRSWNRLYATGMWQCKNLFVATRVWYRIPEDEKSAEYYAGSLGAEGANEEGDDNPDIQNYLGYGDIKLDYLYKNSQFGLLLRNNLRRGSENKGAVELNYSYPFMDSSNTFWYIKLFKGYGESLIDYNRDVTKAAVGLSFSRGLF